MKYQADLINISEFSLKYSMLFLTIYLINKPFLYTAIPSGEFAFTICCVIQPHTSVIGLIYALLPPKAKQPSSTSINCVLYARLFDKPFLGTLYCLNAVNTDTLTQYVCPYIHTSTFLRIIQWLSDTKYVIVVCPSLARSHSLSLYLL